MNWRIHVINALTLAAKKLSPQGEKQMEKYEKASKKKNDTKVWVEVTSQPEKKGDKYVGHASFQWKKDKEDNRHSQIISLGGPAKLSIKSKKLHVAPKDGKAYNYGEEAKATKKPKVTPGATFDKFKDKKLTLQDVLDQGSSAREAFGHLEPSKYPPPDIDPSKVKIDLTGDLDSKPLMVWPDTKGRGQYAYTPAFHRRTAAKKWARVKKLDAKFEGAKSSFAAAYQDDSKPLDDRDAAAVLSIITETGLRPGRRSHLKKSGNRGIATLSAGNVTIDGDVINLKFIGKSSKENKSSFTNPELAKYLAARKEGKQDGDLLFDVKDGDLSPMMDKAGLDSFKPKDFRTLIATRKGAEALSALKAPPPPLPENENKAKRLIKKKVKEASTVVADVINNTPAIAQKSYISPAVIEGYINRVGGNMSMLGASANTVSRVVAKSPPTAEEIWKEALQVDLPGADEEAEDIPEDADDEELDSDILPEELETEDMSDDDKEEVVATLRAAIEVLGGGNDSAMPRRSRQFLMPTAKHKRL